MPVVENNSPCPAIARFTFERTMGPSLGNKDIGTYYTFASDRTIAAANMYLGFGGYVRYIPPVAYNVDFRGLARSTPAPVLLGTTEKTTIVLKALYHYPRGLAEKEEFERGAPLNIGPYAGTLKIYDIDGTTLKRTITNAYYKDIVPVDDETPTFYEYDLVFEAELT